MAINKVKSKRDEEGSSEGNRAIMKFRVSDAIMMFILVILCATCILPFLHLASKSISGNSFVMAKQIYLWPKGINFDAYISIFKDGSMVYSMIYSVIVTAVFTLLGMICCICAAYPLSKKNLIYIPIDASYVLWSGSDSFLPAIKGSEYVG